MFIQATQGDIDIKQEVFKRLDILAEKLGTTAKYLWGVLVRQGVAQGIADVVLAAIFVGLAITGIYLIRTGWVNGFKPENANERSGIDDWPIKDRYITQIVLGFFLAIGCGIAFGIYAYNGILELANPEYFAITQVLDAIRGATGK